MYGQLRQRGRARRGGWGTPKAAPFPKESRLLTVGWVEKFGADQRKAARLERWGPEVTCAASKRPHPPRSKWFRPRTFHS